jgi:S-adenosyl methyltransferase
VAQRVAPESRIVYADNDPIVQRLVAALAPGSFDHQPFNERGLG